MEEYFLDQDNSSHWCIIPVEKKESWEMWLELDEDDEKSWEYPDFVVLVEGSPTLVKFKSYRIGV